MNLIIDIGNTRAKIAVFNKNKLLVSNIFLNDNFIENALETIKEYKCKNAIISSVANVDKKDMELLSSKIKVIELDFQTKVPFSNKYLTPKTLGVDRIALVSAAVSKFPYNNVLIIDSGTCITYDFINKYGEYYGGAISPGISMRYKAINNFTHKLPLLNQSKKFNLVGNSTETCIHSGVLNGVLNEIKGVITQYEKKNKDLTTVLTGGDIIFLANKLKIGIFANPNFLLEGLNKILTYNL